MKETWYEADGVGTPWERKPVDRQWTAATMEG